MCLWRASDFFCGGGLRAREACAGRESCLRDLFWLKIPLRARPLLAAHVAVLGLAEDHVVVGVDGKAATGKAVMQALRDALARVGSDSALQIYVAPAALVVGGTIMVRTCACV